MKPIQMIVFLTIVITIYGSVHWFVYLKGWKSLSDTNLQIYYTWLFWIISSTFILGMFLERSNPGPFSHTISLIGSLWLALFLYFLLFILLVEFFRGIHYFTGLIPLSWLKSFLSPKNLFFIGLSISVIIVGIGYLNARSPILKTIQLSFEGYSTTAEKIKVVVASDVHLGGIIGKNKAEKLVQSINDQNPDLVLFAGDLVDHNPDPVIKENMGKSFEKIRAKHGVYAITGNHEYIGAAEKTIRYFADHQIKYLRDTVLTIPGLINIIGREDKDKTRFTGIPRKSLEQLKKESHPELPSILLDHQPVEYNEVQNQSINLMISGHTHKGQLWPFNYITNAMFENHYGLMQKNGTAFYTSCGYGTWGPPVRIGNRPELVVFEITLNN